MPDHHDTVTPSGSIARKGHKGFLPSNKPLRNYTLRVRLTDKEKNILERLADQRNCTMASLIRQMVQTVASY